MLKRSFLGFSKAYLAYDKITGPPQAPLQVPIPRQLTYIVKSAWDPAFAGSVKTGQKVKTGEKLSVSGRTGGYALATAGGTVAAVAGFAGDFGEMWTRITVDRVENGDALPVTVEPGLEGAIDRLLPVPGAPALAVLNDPERPVDTIVVNGVDQDLGCVTALHAATADIGAVSAGIGVLRQLAPDAAVVMVVSRDFLQGYGHIGADIKAVDNRYPAGHPHNIMSAVLGRPVPAGKSCEEMGVCFLRAEAVASLGKAFETGVVPVDKVLTLVDKKGERRLVSARVGTPIRDVFDTFGVELESGDRIIFGGPMAGRAVFSEDHPVEPDTDAIMVQGGGDIALPADTPCINCGECVRVCPTRVPVNMLVRFLEAKQYETAADEYDLYSCVECGLCSFVCVSKIPISQYIKLAKFELGLKDTEEASNE